MTTTDLATRNDTSLELLPPQQPPSLVARQMLLQHAEMMQTAFELATPMVKTTMVPARFKGKPEDATAAILYGAELGLNPIQSLQRIIPIHGMPSLEARTMVALLKSRGYKIRTTAQSDESVTVWGKDLDGDQYESTWTFERAVKARYVPIPASADSLKRPEVDDDWVTVTKTWDGKSKTSVVGNMKYITDPQAMLKAKAQSEVCRDMAPDILLGICYTREDLESEGFTATAPAQRETSSSAEPLTVDEIMGEDEAAEQKPGQDGGNDAGEGAGPSSGATFPPPPRDQDKPFTFTKPTRKKWQDRMFALFGDVTDRIEQIAIQQHITGRDDIEHRDELTDEELRDVVNMLNDWDKGGTFGVNVRRILGLPEPEPADDHPEEPVQEELS